LRNKKQVKKALIIPSGNDNEIAIKKCVQVLRRGGVIIVPTETVYGLVADMKNEKAVKNIFKIKKRPHSQPLQVLASSTAQAKRLFKSVPVKASVMMKNKWPGPLTLVLKKSSVVNDTVTGGLDTVGVRVPDHGFVRKLIRAYGVPLAATSANLSGNKPPVSASEISKAVLKNTDLIIDGGKCQIGRASMVLDATSKRSRIIRK
jgi:L-threonylcarbamoyladenylate synthase